MVIYVTYIVQPQDELHKGITNRGEYLYMHVCNRQIWFSKVLGCHSVVVNTPVAITGNVGSIPADAPKIIIASRDIGNVL